MIRNSGWLLMAVVLAACSGGGGGNQTGSGASATATTPPSAAPQPEAAAGGAAQPISGKTWDVRMFGDAKGYRFEPATLTIKSGDGVRWTNVNGGPHNVTFWPDSIPQGAQQILQSNMPQQMSALTGPLLTDPSATYTVSFGGAPKGVYHYYCTPHLAVGMKGTITVQ